MAKVDMDKLHDAATRLASLTSPEVRLASGMGIGWMQFYDGVLREIIAESGYYLPEPRCPKCGIEFEKYDEPKRRVYFG